MFRSDLTFLIATAIGMCVLLAGLIYYGNKSQVPHRWDAGDGIVCYTYGNNISCVTKTQFTR